MYVCQKCGKPLDRWYDGFWDITAPGDGSRSHGYSISQMDCVWISASNLKEVEMNAPSKSFFYNYSLGRPYQDKSLSFNTEDVLSNINDYDRPYDRSDYVLVASGLDWGENNHHIVTMGMRDNGEIDMLNLKEIPRSKGIEHIEEDINYVIQDLNVYNPDIIIVDKGFNGNYNDILMKYYGEGRVYSCIVRSAKSNGDPIAHFNTSDSTVTIDKLTQNIIALSNMKRGSIKFWRGSDHDPDIALFCRHWSNVIFRTDETEDINTHEIGAQQVISRKGGD